MKKTALSLALSATALCFSAPGALADYTLTILHFNDWHSRIEPINKFEATCSPEDDAKGACVGGAARLKTAIDQERKKLAGQNVILLDAGDNFQGSLFYTTYKGSVEAEFTNLFKVDAMTVGNHEFDDGEAGLAAFLDKVHFPVVSANIAAARNAKIGDRVKPYTVLAVGGQKIGIVGAVTNDADVISSPGPNVLITNDVAGVTAAVAELQKQGVDKIIALTHVGYQRDLSAIARIPGVDVVVGGHSHTLLSNTDKNAAGPCPTFAGNLDGYQVPVVTAASYSKLLGEVTVTFDDKGIVKSAKGDPIPLDAKIPEDPEVVARVKELAGPIKQAMSKVVAEAAAPIDADRVACRSGECAMGDLVADAMLDRAAKQGVTIAITNGGGLRASIGAGPITVGDIVAVLPFQNTLSTFQLSGKDVVAALENGVSQVSDGAGRFPQVAGLRFSFDRTVGPNSGRIRSVEVKAGDGWQPIKPEKLYLVASNNYMRAGGDGYAVLRDRAKNAYDYGPDLAEVLTTYLQAHQPYKAYTDGRIKDTTPKVVDSTKTKPAAVENAAPATMPDLPAGSMKLASEPPAVEAPNAKPETPAEGTKAAENGGTQVPDLPAASMKLASEPPAVEAPNAKPEAPAKGTKAAENGGIKMPDLPAMSQTLATQPPKIEPSQPANPPAESAAPQPSKAQTPAPAAPPSAAKQPAMTQEAKPAAPRQDEGQAGAEATHIVVAGDNYWKLAKTIYGDPALWQKIAKANPAFRTQALPVGATLKIPAR
jgi:5'-nucleotidase